MNENEEVAGAPESTHAEPPMSGEEERARHDGWVPQAEFKGNPDEWRSAQAYNDRGVLIGSVRAAQKTATDAQARADKALERNNIFHQQQNDMQKKRIDDLERRLKATVEVGDTAEFERIDAEIKAEKANYVPVEPIEETPPPQVDRSEAVSLVEEWNAENPWIKEHSPEAAFAKAEFERYMQQNNTPGKDPTILMKGAIAAVEHAMDRGDHDNQSINENRSRPSKFSRGRRGAGRSTGTLTMADLDRGEMGVWRAQQSAYANEEEFLAVVADARRGVNS
jgi:hypothetical protein